MLVNFLGHSKGQLKIILLAVSTYIVYLALYPKASVHLKLIICPEIFWISHVLNAIYGWILLLSNFYLY